jgi:hypothetical protein
MKLTDLKSQFLKIVNENTFDDVDDIKEADSLLLLCPVRAVGTHSIICWQPHVPLTVLPKPGRWKFIGTGYSDLTLQAGSSSIFLSGDGCKAHFFIRNGEIV